MMDEQLYLFEVMIDNIYFEESVEEVPPKKQIVVSVKLGNIVTLEIRSESLPISGEGPKKRHIDFRAGRSYLCPLSCDQLVETLERKPLEITVGVRGDLKPIGTSSAPWDDIFKEMVLEAKDPKEFHTPASIFDNFCLMDSGAIKGNVQLLLRLTCFGRDVQTQFEVNQDSGNTQFIFKSANMATTFMCTKVGTGTSNDFIPVYPLYNIVAQLRSEGADRATPAPKSTTSWTTVLERNNGTAVVSKKSSIQSECLFPDYLSLKMPIRESAMTFDIVSLVARPDEDRFLDFLTGKKINDMDSVSIQSITLTDTERIIFIATEETNRTVGKDSSKDFSVSKSTKACQCPKTPTMCKHVLNAIERYEKSHPDKMVFGKKIRYDKLLGKRNKSKEDTNESFLRLRGGADEDQEVPPYVWKKRKGCRGEKCPMAKKLESVGVSRFAQRKRKGNEVKNSFCGDLLCPEGTKRNVSIQNVFSNEDISSSFHFKCTNRHCPAAKMFKKLGLGPLAIEKCQGTLYGPVKMPIEYGMSQTYGVWDTYGPFGIFSKTDTPFLPKEDTEEEKRSVLRLRGGGTETEVGDSNLRYSLLRKKYQLRLRGGGKVTQFGDHKKNETKLRLKSGKETTDIDNSGVLLRGVEKKTKVEYSFMTNSILSEDNRPILTLKGGKPSSTREKDIKSRSGKRMMTQKMEDSNLTRLRAGGTKTEVRKNATAQSPLFECREVMQKFDKILEEYREAIEFNDRTIYNNLEQYMDPSLKGFCGHPRCTYISEPVLPPIHWDCPEPLPIGLCQNPDCPYLPQDLKRISKILQARQEKRQSSSNHKSETPTTSPECKNDCSYYNRDQIINVMQFYGQGIGNPKVPLKELSNCSNPECPMTKNESLSEPCSNPSCPFAMGEIEEACSNPECPFREASEPCSNPDCPFKQFSDDACQNPECPFKEVTSGMCPQAQGAGDNVQASVESVCKNPICPFKSSIDQKSIKEVEESECKCNNPKCPANINICSATECPYNILNLDICENPDCPQKSKKKKKTCGLIEKSVCADITCPFREETEEEKEKSNNSQIYAMEEGIFERKSGTKPSVYEFAPCQLKNCKVMGGKLKCEDCFALIEGKGHGPCPPVCPGDTKCPLALGTLNSSTLIPDKSVLKKRVIKREKKKFIYHIGDKYPGVQVGHRKCIVSRLNVPNKMGWLWNVHTPCLSLKPRKGWRPGYIGKTILEMIQNHRRSLNMPPLEIPKARRRRRYGYDESLTELVRPRPTLQIHKKDGVYYITMNPLKDPNTLVKNENPYMECTPMQFKIVKNNNKDKENDYKTCVCNDQGLVYEPSESSSSESELDIEFTPPAGLIHPENFTKIKNVVHMETQYDTEDFMTISQLRERKQKAKKRKNKKKKGKKN